MEQQVLLDVNLVRQTNGKLQHEISEGFPEIPEGHVLVVIFYHKSSPFILRAQVIGPQSYKWVQEMYGHYEISELEFHLISRDQAERFKKPDIEMTPATAN